MTKYFAIVALVTLTFYACNDSSTEEINVPELQGEAYFDANVSIFDARARGISAADYVKELYLVDFGADPQTPQSVTFQGTVYSDNGVGFDAVAGDGIFTSLESFVNTKFPNLQEGEVLSVLEAPMLKREVFAHFDELQLLAENYQFREAQLVNGRPEIIECEASIEVGTNDCLAAEWGWCSDCCVTITVDLDNCTVGI